MTRRRSSSATPPARPDAGEEPGTRQRLVQAALALVEESGYETASVQAIADRAGLSAGALYRHFASKAELFVEVFRTSSARNVAAIDEAAASGSCVERLEAAIVTHARRVLKSRRLAWALLYEPVDALVDEERLVYRRKYCRHMAGLLRQGVAAGEIPEQDVELTAAALIGAVSEALVGPLSPLGGQVTSADEVVASLLRFCRRSVGIADPPAIGRLTPAPAKRPTGAPGSVSS